MYSLTSIATLITIIIVIIPLTLMRIEAQGIKSTRLLDLVIRDYTFKSYNTSFRTGTVHTIDLPSNFSGIKVDTVRFRCGSLTRYGAQVNEFHIGPGVLVLPCVERVMVIIQNLGYNWSSLYYSNYDLSGYQLISPILGLLAYNVGGDVNFSNPFEVGIQAGEKPITIRFHNTEISTSGSSSSSNLLANNNASGISPMCASFESDGKVTLKNPVSPFVCVSTRHGHYGLVIKAPSRPPPSGQVVTRRRISVWKVVVGSTVGSALGAFLLGLLLVAMVVKVKKKAKMEELERRAYEEEALQVSMVGHVRAPTAAGTRTTPSIEHQYRAYPSSLN